MAYGKVLRSAVTSNITQGRVLRSAVTTVPPAPTASGRVLRSAVTSAPTGHGRVLRSAVTSAPAASGRVLRSAVHTVVELVANAGADQAVDSLTRVYLSGLASSGYPTWWRWEQTAGPAVALQPSADVAQPSLIAPATDAGTVLRFELTVGNDEGAVDTSPDLIQVTVGPHVDWVYLPAPGGLAWRAVQWEPAVAAVA